MSRRRLVAVYIYEGTSCAAISAAMPEVKNLSATPVKINPFWIVDGLIIFLRARLAMGDGQSPRYPAE